MIGGPILGELVAVTGGNGRLGGAVVAMLLEHGYSVRAIVRRRARGASREVDWRELDVADEAALGAALGTVSAVVHTAAIPSPGHHADNHLFYNNVGGTFAVVRTAEAQGIDRVVLSGSVSALGGAWARERFPPDYAPVDEDHALRPEDVYGLTKAMDEEFGRWLARRVPSAAITLLRFHWILSPDELQQAVADVAQDPASMAHLLWGYVDVRDAATACLRAIQRETSGFVTATITAQDTLSEEPTEQLIRSYAPQTEIRHPIPARSTAWSQAAARQMLGYSPVHSWYHEGSATAHETGEHDGQPRP